MQKEDNKTYKILDDAINNYVSDYHSSYRIRNNKTFSFQDFFNNKMLIIKTIRKGLPYSLFMKIKDITPFTDMDWANYLNISTKTLQRNKQEKNFSFKPIHTEKIIELAEVTNFGLSVFGDLDKFYKWINTPALAFNDLKPAELLKDSYGKEMVMEELIRIEHGIFA